MEQYIVIFLLICSHHLAAPAPFPNPIAYVPISPQPPQAQSTGQYNATPQPGSGDDDNSEENVVVVDQGNTDKAAPVCVLAGLHDGGDASNVKTTAANKMCGIYHQLNNVLITLKDASPWPWNIPTIKQEGVMWNISRNTTDQNCELSQQQLNATIHMLRCNFGYIGEILQNLTELQMQGNQNVSKARDAIYRAYANVTAIGDELESGFPCHQDDTSLATTSMCLPYSSLTLFIDGTTDPSDADSLCNGDCVDCPDHKRCFKDGTVTKMLAVAHVIPSVTTKYRSKMAKLVDYFTAYIKSCLEIDTKCDPHIIIN